MPEYDSPLEKLRQEFEILVGQNNELMRELPAYTVAQLYQLVDAERMKHDVPIVEVRDEGDDRYILVLDEEQSTAALLGFENPDDLADIDVAMIDDRGLGRGP